MKTAGPESKAASRPARARKHGWRTMCDIVFVLAIAYFVFLIVAVLMAPEGTRDWTVFSLHFVVTILLGYGAKWFRDRHDKRHDAG